MLDMIGATLWLIGAALLVVIGVVSVIGVALLTSIPLALFLVGAALISK